MPLKCEKLCSLSSLSSKFSDLKVIAGGGGGVVLSGIDKSISEGQCFSEKENPAVALKRLSLVGKGHCRVALRELRLLKRFKHENIVRTIKITDSSGSTIDDPSMENFKDLDSVYVVEELLDTDLHKIIERNGKLSLDTCKVFLYQLLRGLKYIHSANVIHRDIKPGNTFINAEDLTLKIGDYGLARVFDKRFDHKGYLTAVVSTRYYRAPEVMLNLGNYSFPVDIWSAGCVFGEMLLGKVMFAGENDLDQINVICSAFGLKIDNFYQTEPSFPEHMFDGIPPEAVDLLIKMLCIDPSQRITAEEALQHPFLSDFYDPLDEPECDNPFFIEHEVDNLPMKILKRKILRKSCLNSFEKKSYHSSEESLFKDFDEVLIPDPFCYKSSSNIKLNSRGDETDFTSSGANTSIESCCSLTAKDCIPSLKDAMSREEIIDEPYRDPGVCERKYHDLNTASDALNIPSISFYDTIIESCETDHYSVTPSQQSDYFSNLSPVIDISEPNFPTIPQTHNNNNNNKNNNISAGSQHFLEIHGRSCANDRKKVISSSSNYSNDSTSRSSIKSLNQEILRNLSNRTYVTQPCHMEDLMTKKYSKTAQPLVHWDSIRFWI